MMKKNLVAVALMAVAGVAVAAPETYAPGDTTDRQGVATTYEYDVSGIDRADRLFIKNNFEFTLSTNVVLTSEEDDDGRFFVVGTVNTQGRNVYVGHSNGGSVNGCGDPLTAAEAKVAGALESALSDRFDASEDSGCSES